MAKWEIIFIYFALALIVHIFNSTGLRYGDKAITLDQIKPGCLVAPPEEEE